MPKPKPDKTKPVEKKKEIVKEADTSPEETIERHGILPDDLDFRRGMGCG